MRDMEGNLPSAYFYPELPPREIFVDAQSDENNGSTTPSAKKQPTSSAMSTPLLNQDHQGSRNNGEKLPKARFFTFEGLTPVSTVDDSREDTGDIASPEASSRVVMVVVTEPRQEEEEAEADEENREEAPSVPVRALLDYHPRLRCWTLEEEETPFDEDPIFRARHVPRSCPAQVESVTTTTTTAAVVVEATKEVMSTFSNGPQPEPVRLNTLSDVSETSSGQNLPKFTTEEIQPAINKVQEAATPMALIPPDNVMDAPTHGAAEKGVALPPAPFTANTRNPSSLLDNDEVDDEDDGIVEREYDVVMAPSDELEDRRLIENILRDAETSNGCDVDICKHLTNSSNDICVGFSKLLSI